MDFEISQLHWDTSPLYSAPDAAELEWDLTGTAVRAGEFRDQLQSRKQKLGLAIGMEELAIRKQAALPKNGGIYASFPLRVSILNRRFGKGPLDSPCIQNLLPVGYPREIMRHAPAQFP